MVALPEKDNFDQCMQRWNEVKDYCGKMYQADPKFDVVGYFFDHKIGWTELIKTLRSFTGDSLYGTFARALAHEGWRRWCAQRCAENRRCEKQARFFARDYPDQNLVKLRDGRPTFKP